MHRPRRPCRVDSARLEFRHIQLRGPIGLIKGVQYHGRQGGRQGRLQGLMHDHPAQVAAQIAFAPKLRFALGMPVPVGLEIDLFHAAHGQMPAQISRHLRLGPGKFPKIQTIAGQ